MHAENRNRFFESMGDGIAIIAAPGELQRNFDNEYRYRPESTFWWLTGLEEAEAIAVFWRRGRERRFVLFMPPRDVTLEMWTGRRLGPEGARRHLGASAAHPVAEFAKRLDDLLKGHQRLFLALDGGALQNQVFASLNRMVRRRKSPGALPAEVRDVRRLVGELRLRKTPTELALMERAASVTGEAFREVMRLTRPGLREYQLRAVFPLIYGLHGADWSFETIVAGGANACVLHYVTCRDELKDGDLVVCDAGSEVDCFGSDVTRTFPVNGRFNKDQERIYNVVLRAHAAAVAAALPGAPIDAVHQAAAETTVEGLMELGLLKGRHATLVAKQAWKRWFPHGTSHWLGLDTHDQGDYALDEGPRLLEAGMVITVEPGLYLPPGDKKVPERYRGIGVRIEDDVLITATGNRLLTQDIPREPREIEAAMATRPRYLKALPDPPKPVVPLAGTTKTRKRK